MLLSACLLSIILSVILILNNRKVNKNSVYLGIYLILISLYAISHYVVVSSQSKFWVAVVLNHLTPLNLLTGPALYFYIRGTIKDSAVFYKKDLLHFIPASIHLIGIIPYLLQPFSYKEKVAALVIANIDNIRQIPFNFIFKPDVAFVMRPGLLFIYLIYCFYILIRYKYRINKKEVVPQKQLITTFRWILLLLLSSLIFLVNFSFITYEFLMKGAEITISQYYLVLQITGVSYFFVSFSLLFFPNVLYGFPSVLKRTPEIVHITEPEVQASSPYVETQQQQVDEKTFVDFTDLANSILAYAETKHPYLNNSFNIQDISVHLGVPSHHVYYCFSNVLKIKFTDWRSKLRVEYTKKLMLDGQLAIKTMEGIGKEAGFNSRSTFYAAFKVETGKNPAEWLQEVKAKKNNLL